MIRNQAKEKNRHDFERQKKILDRKSKTALVVTMLFTLCLTSCLSALCLGRMQFQTSWLALLLIATEFVLTGCRLWTLRAADKAAALHIACEYQDRAALGDIIRFLSGKRVNAAFQDKGNANQKRQKLRRILWLWLMILIVASFLASLAVCRLPVFFALSFAILIAFIHADNLPSTYTTFETYAENYVRYNPRCDVPLDTPFTLENGMGMMFREEWKNTGFSRIPPDCNLFTVQERARSTKSEWADLPVECIQQCYKMAWDQKKNVRLVQTLALVVANLASAMVALLPSGTSTIIQYFCIPTAICLPVTLLAVAATGVVNCYLTAIAEKDSYETAQLAFRSRYLFDTEELKVQFRSDVAAGLLNIVALKRGIFQHTAKLNSGTVKQRRELFSQPRPARMAFHHLAIGNSSRLATTVWLAYGSLFCLFVWLFQIVWLLPVLLLGTVIVHRVLKKYWLPFLHKRKIIRVNKTFDERMGAEAECER